jgi:hypothetical protein
MWAPRGERQPARAPTGCRPAAWSRTYAAPRAPEPDNNRRANEGANANADTPFLFRWASQNLADAAMLLRGYPEPATSEEQRVL